MRKADLVKMGNDYLSAFGIILLLIINLVESQTFILK
jgi:hypothetical protein